MFHGAKVFRFWLEPTPDIIHRSGLINQENIETVYFAKDTGLVGYIYNFGTSSHGGRAFTLKLEEAHLK